MSQRAGQNRPWFTGLAESIKQAFAEFLAVPTGIIIGIKRDANRRNGRSFIKIERLSNSSTPSSRWRSSPPNPCNTRSLPRYSVPLPSCIRECRKNTGREWRTCCYASCRCWETTHSELDNALSALLQMLTLHNRLEIASLIKKAQSELQQSWASSIPDPLVFRAEYLFVDAEMNLLPLSL